MTTLVAQEHSGMRLDVFLQRQETGHSRSQIQKMIKEGLVTVNKKKVSPHHFLKEGDTVIINVSSVITTQAGSQSKDDIPSPHIIAETPEYIIIDKPAGLTVHPVSSSPARATPTLVDWLLERYPRIQKVGDDPLRPGIVHRLDKDASGAMVIARTQESFESLVRQFKLRTVKKEYRILVYGHVTPQESVIDFPIGRSKKLYTRRAAHTGVIQSHSAVTKYDVIEYFKNTSLVQVIPETGRTHQIRVHFFAKGTPVVGDILYPLSSPSSRKRGTRKSRRIQSERLMLHAERLGFRDLSGDWHEYTVPPDEDFQKVIERIRVS